MAGDNVRWDHCPAFIESIDSAGSPWLTRTWSIQTQTRRTQKSLGRNRTDQDDFRERAWGTVDARVIEPSVIKRTSAVSTPRFGPVSPVAAPSGQPVSEASTISAEFRFANARKTWSLDASYLLSGSGANWSGINSSDEAVHASADSCRRSTALLSMTVGTHDRSARDGSPHASALGNYDLPWALRLA